MLPRIVGDEVTSRFLYRRKFHLEAPAFATAHYVRAIDSKTARAHGDKKELGLPPLHFKTATRFRNKARG